MLRRASRRTAGPVKSALVLLLSMALTVPLAAVSPSVAAAEPTPPLSVKVDFSTTTTSVPAGWTPDLGAAFDETAGLGWIRQDSLAGTHVPYGIAINARDRGCTTTGFTGANQPLRSFIHMQAGASTSTPPNTDTTPVAWEYRLPNGRYQVTVGVGDPNAGSSPEIHNLRVEGVTAVNKYSLATGTAT